MWDSATAVEIAILDWVHWWNTARLHESLAYRTPAQVEAACTEIEATAPVVP
ncbi:transposase [Kocuria indica]|nr:transposase [Kocuria indica]